MPTRLTVLTPNRTTQLPVDNHTHTTGPAYPQITGLDHQGLLSLLVSLHQANVSQWNEIQAQKSIIEHLYAERDALKEELDGKATS